MMAKKIPMTHLLEEGIRLRAWKEVGFNSHSEGVYGHRRIIYSRYCSAYFGVWGFTIE